MSAKQWGAFMPGVPDVAEFPARTWSRLQARLWKEANPDLLTYAPGGGYRPLRRALSDYLRVARSVNCTPDQIIITTGIHQSIDLAVRLLTDVGDRAWVEEPCYWGARSVLQSSGITLVPVPVDDEGLNPREQDLQQPPRLALVTPSHQYPLGMVMSLARRRTLLEYARQHNVWIIEDDYDSEFRYGSRPLASLQGLDDAGQVIYVGSLGKMLFPGLRIGYMIAPEHLVDTFRTGVAELYREGQLMQQAVMTDFIMDGHLTSHVRRMRALYGERRQILIDAITARFGNELPVMGDEAGLHLVLGLPGSRERSRGDGGRLRRRRDRAAARELLQQRYARAARTAARLCVRAERQDRSRVRHARARDRANRVEGADARRLSACRREHARPAAVRSTFNVLCSTQRAQEKHRILPDAQSARPRQRSLQAEVDPRRRALILDAVGIQLRRDDKHAAAVDLAVQILLHALRALLRELAQAGLVDRCVGGERALHVVVRQALGQADKIARLLEVRRLVGLASDTCRSPSGRR